MEKPFILHYESLVIRAMERNPRVMMPMAGMVGVGARVTGRPVSAPPPATWT